MHRGPGAAACCTNQGHDGTDSHDRIGNEGRNGFDGRNGADGRTVRSCTTGRRWAAAGTCFAGVSGAACALGASLVLRSQGLPWAAARRG